jgi:4-amino-4-deoxy-L-arabinose transferase-like glycosyltransferase
MRFDDKHLSTSRFYIKITLLLILMAVICSITVLSWVPPVSRDALTHHLAVPKLYLQQGGIYEIPSITFSYYPMNLDLLYILPLYFKNDIVPKFIHFAFGLLTAWLIFVYLRKRLDTLWALFGVTFFVSLPIIVKLSISVYVDLGLVFFSTASIASIFNWIESRFKLKFLLLAAVCCGLAMGTKYNGLIVLFILTLFIPLVFIRKSMNRVVGEKPEIQGHPFKTQLKALGFGALYCSMALLVFSPWMIRNYIWKANPVYPLYNSFFNSPPMVKAQIPVTSAELDAGDQTATTIRAGSTKWGPLAIRKVVYNESWWEIALIPVRIFFQGQDDNPKYFDGKLNPFLFLLPFFAFLQSQTNPRAVGIEKKFLLSFSILFILYAFLQRDMRIRYIAPIIAPLVILSTFGFHRIHSYLAQKWSHSLRRPSEICVIMLAAVIFFFNAVYIAHQFKQVDPFSYISGRVGRDDYITIYRPEYTIIQYANRHLSADAKILVLFMGNRRYYSDRDLIFNVNLFRTIVKKADSAQAVLHELQQRGFSNLLIRYDLFNHWTDKQFNDREKKMLKMFFVRDVRHVSSNSGYGLYELAENR